MPRSKSLAVWAIFALAVVVLSYVLTLALAAAAFSVPLLVILSTGVTGYLAALFVLFGALTGASLLWSLVPRRDRFTAPGIPIDAASQPALFAEIERLATALREPVPSQVFVTGDVNAWVAKRGGTMGFGGRRVMAIGLPFLYLLTRAELRAILAHEFAHYYGGDTQLGPWVYSARNAMARSLETLASEKSFMGRLSNHPFALVIQAPVLAALRAYWKFFLRATQLVSRRQELRADELACRIAGSDPLVGGLCKVHRARAVLQSYLQTEVNPALQSGFRPPLGEGLAMFLAAPTVYQAASSCLATELKKTATTPYDSHPPLGRRTAAAQRLACDVSSADAGLPAASLLVSPDALEVSLLKLNPQLKTEFLVPRAWDSVCQEVHVPRWKASVSQHASVLAGFTLESLPDAIARRREIGSKIRDPQGFLLTPEQRDERALLLLCTAVSIALAGDGWDLRIMPGQNYAERGEDRICAFDIVTGLRAGTMSRAAWVERCRELRIAALPLDGSGALPLSSLFRGPWKENPVKSHGAEATVTFTKAQGGIRQSANANPFEIDGRDYPMGRPGATHSWRVIAPGVYECTLKQNGLATATVIRAMSEDRNSFTLTNVDAASGGRTTSVWKRIGEAVDSEPLVGTWKQDPATRVTDQRAVFEPVPNGIRALSGVPGRMSLQFAGLFDGKAHAAANPSNSFVILQQYGPRAFTATLGAGKIVTSVTRYELSSDGQTLTQQMRLVGGLQFLIVYDRAEETAAPQHTEAPSAA